jgi:hypothetical protein
MTLRRVRVPAAFQSAYADIYSGIAYLGQHKAALVSEPSDRIMVSPGNVPSKVVTVIYPLGHSPGLSSLKLSNGTRGEGPIEAEVTVVDTPLGILS